MITASPLGRLIIIIAILLGLSLSPEKSIAETDIVEGQEVWRIFLTPAGAPFKDLYYFKDYRNESNQQIILEANPQRVVIERRVNYAPLRHDLLLSRASIYQDQAGLAKYLAKPSSSLLLKHSDKLAEGKSTQVEYVDAVMYDVRDRLVWRSTSVVEAEAVFKSGFTLCAGFANLAVALLRAKGIPARVGHVLNLRHPSWNAGGHAEVEVYYQDLGWVSYDPQMHNHHGPMPRIYYGNGVESTIWSNNAELWGACTYFNTLSYNISYQKISQDIRVLGVEERPTKHDFIGRDNGFTQSIPSICGQVYDGTGKLSTDDWLYGTLDATSRSYSGIELRNGSYILRNDSDGGRLYLNKNGFVVFYDFPGFEKGALFKHDIRFDPSDSIVINTGKPDSQVKWYFQPSSFYTFTADGAGIIRIHVNPDKGTYKVNDETYYYRNGIWRLGE